MAKHPVPKYKKTKRKTRQQHAAFAYKAKVRLIGMVNLIDCPKCKQKTLNHHACKNCGYYKGKKILDLNKEVDKITKVKA